MLLCFLGWGVGTSEGGTSWTLSVPGSRAEPRVPSWRGHHHPMPPGGASSSRSHWRKDAGSNLYFWNGEVLGFKSWAEDWQTLCCSHIFAKTFCPRTFSRHPNDVKIKRCSFWQGFKVCLKAGLDQMLDSYRFCSAVSPGKHTLSDRWRRFAPLAVSP